MGAPALKGWKVTGRNLDSFNKYGFWSPNTPYLQCCFFQSWCALSEEPRGGWSLEGLALLAPPRS